MAEKRINLNTPVVESREQRLGTIIAWDGKASDLSKESAYARGGCGGDKNGSGCRLCEVRGPFAHCTQNLE